MPRTVSLEVIRVCHFFCLCHYFCRSFERVGSINSGVSTDSLFPVRVCYTPLLLLCSALAYCTVVRALPHETIFFCRLAQTLTPVICYKLRFTCTIQRGDVQSVKSMEVKEATHVVKDGIGDLQESLLNYTQSDR